jgi:hypothetical protein
MSVILYLNQTLLEKIFTVLFLQEKDDNLSYLRHKHLVQGCDHEKILVNVHRDQLIPHDCLQKKLPVVVKIKKMLISQLYLTI